MLLLVHCGRASAPEQPSSSAAEAGPPDAAVRYERLLAVALARNDVERAQRAADSLLALDPTEPQRIDAAARAFYDAGRQEELLRYFARNLARYETDDAASAALYFARGKLYAAEGRLDWAKADLGAARHRFARSLPAEHPVFGVIDDLLEARAP